MISTAIIPAKHSRIELTRLKAAGEQLMHVKRRRNQQPIRDYAIFHVLLRTGLRVSELLRLDLDQYQGKHFVNVKRKGRKVSRQVFVAAEAREALDRYIEETRSREPGPLFRSRSGNRLARQNVDAALKAIANQANARFPDGQKIRLHAHVLRHTCLRKAAEKHGVQYAMELSGQSVGAIYMALCATFASPKGGSSRPSVLMRRGLSTYTTVCFASPTQV